MATRSRLNLCTLLAAGLSLLALTPAHAATATGQATFSINVPAAAVLRDVISGTTTGTFAGGPVVPTGGNLVGTFTDSWQAFANTSGTATVSTYVTGLSSTGLEPFVRLSAISTAGSPKAVTIIAPYVTGQSLNQIPTATPGANMASYSAPGQGDFTLTLSVNAPFSAGSGTVFGTINLLLSAP